MYLYFSIDNSLMSNIQKLFSEKIEIFSAVARTNISILMSLYFSIDNSLMSNIQKLFSEKIEIFSAVAPLTYQY